MKKLLNYVLILLVLLMPVVSVSAATTTKKTTKATTTATTTTTKATTTTAKANTKVGTPVKLYVFYGSTCSHCAHLHQYLAELEKDTNYNYMFELVDYEVWADKSNAKLMSNVASALGTTASGVPFYVVGDYYSSGFPDVTSTDASVKAAVKEVTDELKEAIEYAYNAQNKNDGSYEDIVASVGSGNATVREKEKDNSANDTIGYIILGITVIIIVAIIFGRSSSKDEDEEEVEETETEEEDEEEIEEVVEEPKKEVKKPAAKKTTAKKTTSKKSTSKSSTKKSTSKKKTK